jgi:hypothetical protein
MKTFYNNQNTDNKVGESLFVLADEIGDYGKDVWVSLANHAEDLDKVDDILRDALDSNTIDINTFIKLNNIWFN